jgi:Fanconi anemia group I protein
MLKEAGIAIANIISENRPVQLRILDILSKIWNVLSATDEENEINDIFNSLMDAEWNNQVVVGIASALNEMELSSAQLERVVKYMTK